MKNQIILSTAAILFAFGITACSKCYECSYDEQVESNGVTETVTTTENVCTADQAEIDEREANGQFCRAAR